MSVKESRSTKAKINSTVVLAAILASVVIIIVVINVWPESKDVDSYVDVADMPVDMPTHNFIDKRYELVLLIFRLSEPDHHVFTPLMTDFHRNLDETFSEFTDHPAVTFARQINSRWNAPFDFAVHIHWNGYKFALIDDTRWLVNVDFSAWRHINPAREFLELLNDFYIDTNFGEFYQANMDLFMSHSANFIRDVYLNFNAEWFRQFGLNPDNLRIAISPSKYGAGFAAWFENDNLYEKVVYAALSAGINHILYSSHMVVVHEFAHAIANPIADRWFSQDLQFWTWARASAATSPVSSYQRSQQKAQEYVTRALTILYFLDNTNRNLQTMFTQERRQGFYHIAEVFDMLMRYLGRYEMVQGD